MPSNPFQNLDDNHDDRSHTRSASQPAGPSRRGRQGDGNGSGTLLVVFVGVGALLLAGGLLVVVALVGGGSSGPTASSEVARIPKKAAAKEKKPEPAVVNPEVIQQPQVPGTPAETTPPPPQREPRPLTREEEAKLEEEIIADLSPMMRTRIALPWKLVKDGKLANMPPDLLRALDDNGMGDLLSREIVRYYQTDPDCQEFRKLTGCETDYQYMQWGRCAPAFRVLALVHVRKAVSEGEDQRDLVPFLKDKIREAGGGDWLSRGPTPKK